MSVPQNLGSVATFRQVETNLYRVLPSALVTDASTQISLCEFCQLCKELTTAELRRLLCHRETWKDAVATKTAELYEAGSTGTRACFAVVLAQTAQAAMVRAGL